MIGAHAAREIRSATHALVEEGRKLGAADVLSIVRRFRAQREAARERTEKLVERNPAFLSTLHEHAAVVDALDDLIAELEAST